MTNQNVLVVAFDGLDIELIKKYDLENIPQAEFGTFDNSTGMSSIITSELFASFITGTNYEDHGVVALETTDRRQKLAEKMVPNFLLENVRGFYRIKESLKTFLGADEGKRYTKDSLEQASLFEKIEGSRAMFVPSYNPSVFWAVGAEALPLKKGYSADETSRYYDSREYIHRKKQLFSELENEILEPRSFLMCHFHRTDMYHHLYGDSDAHFDNEKLEKMYKETDKLAGKIKNKALEKGYDHIIFMSDHGLPNTDEHNENAFYSSNKKIFDDKNPHITDFHDRILELTDNPDKIK
jgi:hypothetical protein